MRGEIHFWMGMFALADFDEIFSVNYNRKHSNLGVPTDMFRREVFYLNRKSAIDKRYFYLKKLKNQELKGYINSQILTHGDFETWLFNMVPDKKYHVIPYFNTEIVQEFLGRIDPALFAKVTYRIAQNPANYAGVADFVVWNKKELFFVEVKREKETLREKQIEWAKWMIENKIPIAIVRVKGI
jgi:hypothetical protein